MTAAGNSRDGRRGDGGSGTGLCCPHRPKNLISVGPQGSERTLPSRADRRRPLVVVVGEEGRRYSIVVRNKNGSAP